MKRAKGLFFLERDLVSETMTAHSGNRFLSGPDRCPFQETNPDRKSTTCGIRIPFPAAYWRGMLTLVAAVLDEANSNRLVSRTVSLSPSLPRLNSNGRKQGMPHCICTRFRYLRPWTIMSPWGTHAAGFIADPSCIAVSI